MAAAIVSRMRHRQPTLPRLWMMTDERQGDDLWAAVERLPKGAGVIFRHHATPADVRQAMIVRLKKIARRRRLVLIMAGIDHHRRPGPPRFGTAPAHDIRQIRSAERSGAAAILLSPVFATRSHPGGRTLGMMRLAALVRATNVPVIALGGMDRRRALRTGRVGAHGWAAIDAWGRFGRDQKRKAVPI